MFATLIRSLLEYRPRPPELDQLLKETGHVKPMGDPRGKLSKQQQNQLKKKLLRPQLTDRRVTLTPLWYWQ